MKVYWRDRHKKTAPAGAVFLCRPFRSDSSICFEGTTETVINLPAPIKPLKIKKQLDLPSQSQWIQNVEEALLENIEKVVLARCQILELEHAPDPFAIGAALKTKAEGAFVFCLQKGTQAFVGASPERLFSRDGNRIFVDAMAGTRAKSHANEKEFLSNKKTLTEIVPVQIFLKERLSPLCSSPLIFSPITIHKTHNVQHLYSQGVGDLKPGISNEEILQAIHPTPALCGSPQEKAFDLIRKLEPFERGLYGGVIGWSHENKSEWAVAIRSCFIDHKIVHLYAGAGIVKGSIGLDEWNELNCKTQLFNEIFIL